MTTHYSHQSQSDFEVYLSWPRDLLLCSCFVFAREHFLSFKSGQGHKWTFLFYWNQSYLAVNNTVHDVFPRCIFLLISYSKQALDFFNAIKNNNLHDRVQLYTINWPMFWIMTGLWHFPIVHQLVRWGNLRKPRHCSVHTLPTQGTLNHLSIVPVHTLSTRGTLKHLSIVPVYALPTQETS